MADEEHKSEPSAAALEMAKLHATAWEDAAGDLSQQCQRDPHLLMRQMGIAQADLLAVKWLAYNVAASYRKIVNGRKLDD